MRLSRAIVSAIVISFLTAPAYAAESKPRGVTQSSQKGDALEPLLFPEVDVEGLGAQGSGVMAALARMYEESDESRRTVIAYAFYRLGWKSPEAKRVLLADIHTANSNLRLQVQWAIGRVSNDADVVDALLDNMQHDDNPLFRDKAACALASDQIHLTEAQKVYLYERLIRALRDPKPDVRSIAAKVLEIQTGQNKGFDANGSVAARESVVRVWERWLDTYRANL